jgi:peptide/nickel transport system permease protein
MNSRCCSQRLKASEFKHRDKGLSSATVDSSEARVESAAAMTSSLKLILDRLLQGIAVLLIVSALTFALLAAAGGDAVTALQHNPQVSEETLNRLRHVYGLDQPLALRYLRWLGGAARGRLGDSIYFQRPVAEVLWPRWWRTLALALAALLLAWPVALLLGVAAAWRTGAWLDRLCSLLVLVGASTPRLLLALVALTVAARAAPATDATALNHSIWLPALVLSVPLLALFLAQTRECVTAALGQEHVRVARAKGLPERRILLRHVLRPALNPLISVFGYSLGGVLSGSIIVEQVLDWPGLGQLSVAAVLSRDVPLLLGVVLLAAAAVLVGNLLADLLLCWNDPRLRNEES